MRLMTRLDRHVVRQVFVPAVMAFFVYTALLLMNGLFSLMEQVVVFGVPVPDALKILLIGIPNVAILTIPVSFLFGVLLAAGRMSSDNELTALLAAGIPPRRLYKPILFLAILLTGLSLQLTFGVIPDSNREMRALKTRFFSSGAAVGRIQPGVFYNEIPQMLLYVEDLDRKTGTWQNVMIHRVVNAKEQQLTLARRGRIVKRPPAEAEGVSGSETAPDEKTENWIVLEDVVNYTFLRDNPEKFLTSMIQTHAFRPDIDAKNSGQKVSYRRSLSELTAEELAERMRSVPDSSTEKDTTGVKEARMAGVELHRRMAIPFASITFALLALPLGIGVRSGSRGRGFLFSILVVLVYYILNSYGSYLVVGKGVPAWVGMWIPNAVLLLAALILGSRMGRWLGERQRPESYLSRFLRFLRKIRRDGLLSRGHGSAERSSPVTGSIPIGLQRRVYGAGFPTLLDRFLMHRLTSPLFLVLLSTISLYLIGDLSNHIDEIARTNPPPFVVLAYYWNLIPTAVLDVLPFSILISVITVLTVLERHHELTALKASGISVFRITVPLLLVAVTGVGAMWILSEKIVPPADAKATRLLDEIRGRTRVFRRSGSQRNWLLARDGRTFYKFLSYDVTGKELVRFSMYRVDSQMRLRYCLFAHRVRYENGAWIADGGWLRNIDEHGSDHFKRITAPTEIGILEGPTYFGQENERPDELSQAELRRYIEELEDSGYRPTRLIVRWHQKFSTPMSVLVLVLLALPFALGRGGGGTRASTMQGVAIALALGVGYFILLVPLFAKLGEADFLPPAVGAWAPVMLGLLFAANRMTHIRT